MWGRSWGERALDILIPETCAACAQDLPPPLSGPLCGGCLEALRPLIKESPLSGGVIRLVSAAYVYRGVLPPMIRAFKFGGRRKIGEALADWMAGLWPRKPELGTPHALVPVPLHPRRERFRGFNQASILARSVGRQAHVPVLEAIIRAKNTPPQRGLSRAKRLKQLTRAFAVKRRIDVTGSRLVLIDDVMTTGGTLNECAKVLRQAGAAEVRAYVLARKL